MKKQRKRSYLTLLKLKNTPTNKVGKSPAQLLMSCNLRTLFPTSHCLLYPHTENPSVGRKRHAEHQKTAAEILQLICR